ncbi:MAG: 13E12 repeat family protein [Actinomycetota bacterium]|nr:13E12 repeat family protein [Actinomycetota bacterium]
MFAVHRRHQAARRERGVSFWELPNGMAMVSACLPAGEAVGVYGILDEYARATGGPGDERTLDARRADALVDLVCDSAGYPQHRHPHRRSHDVPDRPLPHPAPPVPSSGISTRHNALQRAVRGGRAAW